MAMATRRSRAPKAGKGQMRALVSAAGIEIAVGDAGHRSHDRNERDRINEDAEDRDGERQAFGKLVIFKRSRPKADLGDKKDGAEDHGLGREYRREDLQESRDLPRAVGGEGARNPTPASNSTILSPVFKLTAAAAAEKRPTRTARRVHGLPFVIRNLPKYPQVFMTEQVLYRGRLNTGWRRALSRPLADRLQDP